MHAHIERVIRRFRLQAAHALARRAPSGPLHEGDDLGVAAVEAARLEREARRSAPESPLAWLAERAGLDETGETILLCALALELDPAFAVLIQALCGEEPRAGVTLKIVRLVEGAVDDAGPDPLVGVSLDARHPLVACGLVEPSPAAWSMPAPVRPFRVAERVAAFLCGRNQMDATLASLGVEVRSPASPASIDPDGDGPILDDETRSTLAILERALSDSGELLVLVQGPDGVGRRTLIARAAASSDRAVVMLDATRVPADPERRRAELRALRRECWLREAIPVVARVDAEALADRELRAAFVADLIEVFAGPGSRGDALILTSGAGVDVTTSRRVLRLSLRIPAPPVRAQQWRRLLSLAAGDALAIDAGEIDRLAERHALPPRVVERVIENACMIADGTALRIADLHRGIALELQERFGGLATRIEIVQSWDDLVLPGDTLDELKAFVSRAARAAQVYDAWGFRAKLGRGLGLTALLSGPPGTGKTMVAGLIARTLGLELYQVDLSQIVSKWVGETEKQLARIFDAAATGQALLLFDEADALFARRTEVKSSNDRYANLEVNFLLQRLEQFHGVAILTTNLDQSVDPAFRRRLAAEVKFHPPELPERERLWRALLPDAAPRGDDIAFDSLAAEFRDMCGGHIRNAVLRAAFLASAEESVIQHDHLYRAARVEYRAMGKVV